MAYFKTLWQQFRDSFRCKNVFVYVFAYEVLFVLVLAVLSSVFVRALGAIAGLVPNVNLYALDAQVVSQMRAFFVNSLLVALAFLLVLFVAYSLIQMCAWARVLGKNVSGRFLVWCVWANSVWLLPWVLVSWFVIAGMRDQFAVLAFFVLSVLFVHLSWLYQRALLHHGIKKSVGLAFHVGFGQLGRFVGPYIIALAVLWVWAQAWAFVVFNLEKVGAFVAAPTSFTLVFLCCVVFAPYFAWLKFYLVKISA